MHLKVPPVALAAIAAALMVGLSRVLPQFAIVFPYKNAIALAIFLAGLGIAVFGVVSFRRRQTTVNPTRPSTAFVLYMNEYQIEPEEQALLQLFGEAFVEYKKNTRRWF